MKKILTLISILLICGACSTINKSYINAPVGVSASVELDADVTIGDEITGSAQETILFGVIQISGPSKYADNVFGGVKSAAAYNALESSGADVIVNPQYVFEVNNNLIIKTTKCTVTGLAGKVTVNK